jgi:hypothetical protein
MSDHVELANIDKFELLSAYLDGEVSASERQQVEGWLRNDPAFRVQYRRIQGMQQAMDNLPLSNDVVVPVNALADQVFAKISERRQSRWLKIGGGAVAAALIAAGTGFSGILNGFSNPGPQVAKISLPTVAIPKIEIIPNPAPMMVALNNSIVNIPQQITKPANLMEDNDLGLFDALDHLDSDDI